MFSSRKLRAAGVGSRRTRASSGNDDECVSSLARTRDSLCRRERRRRQRTRAHIVCLSFDFSFFFVFAIFVCGSSAFLASFAPLTASGTHRRLRTLHFSLVAELLHWSERLGAHRGAPSAALRWRRLMHEIVFESNARKRQANENNNKK